jgi:fatty-acyl-CoA synthase
VADAIGGFPGVELCAVYGVRVPGTDGRAGMAALRLRHDAGLDGTRLYAHAEGALPSHARPAFVRLLQVADLTATFKIRKVALQREGYDPKAIADPLLYRDDQRHTYLPLSPEVADRIQTGQLRF